MICDKSQSSPIVYNASLDTRTCGSNIVIRSSEACYAFTLNPLFRWVDKQSMFLGAALILAGLYLGLLGKKQFKVSICLTGGVAFLLASSLFLFTVFLNRDSSTATGWIIIGICAFLSIFVGLALAFFFRAGAAVAAGWGGVTLALILYNTFVYKIDNDKKVAFWIFIIAMGGIFGGLAFCAFWHVIIFATAFGGAYAVIRGISLYAGGFIGEMEIVDLINSKKFDSIPATFYAYMVGFIVLSVGFSYFQYRMWGTHSEKDKAGQNKTRHHYHAINKKGRW